MRKTGATLKTVAEEAGVSATAVSMFMNGKAKKYKLSDATCRRIADAVEKHHYTPNLHARAVASGRSSLIGAMIADRPGGSFWMRILTALQETLEDSGCHLLLSTAKNDPARQRAAFEFFRRQGVAACAAVPVPGTENEVRELAASMPVVTLNSHIEGVPGVWNDDYAGGYAAAESVVASGHTAVAYVGLDATLARCRAYDDVMKKHALPVLYFRTAEEFLTATATRDITAAVCVSDYLALELRQQMRGRNLSGPPPVIVGYDNMDFAALLEPPVPSVNQYKEELGTAAAEMLLALLRKPDEIPQKTFLPYLVRSEFITPPDRR